MPACRRAQRAADGRRPLPYAMRLLFSFAMRQDADTIATIIAITQPRRAMVRSTLSLRRRRDIMPRRKRRLR